MWPSFNYGARLDTESFRLCYKQNWLMILTAQEIYKNKALVGLVHAFLGDLYRGVSRIISILGEQHDASYHTCRNKVFKEGVDLKYSS